MVKLINKLKNRKGFTLIELIVVLAVLGVIMAIAVPRFTGVQESARVDADYASGSLIAKTAEIYAIRGMTESEIEEKIKEDFPQDIVFQSKSIKDKKLSANDVSIIVDATTKTVKVEVKPVTGTTEIQIYPNTGELD